MSLSENVVNPNIVPTDVAIRLLVNAARLWDPDEDFTRSDLETLADYADNWRVPQGESVVKQDDSASFITLVLAGTAKVISNGAVVATLGAGSVIGAQSYLSRQRRRNADVVAGEDLILSVLQYDSITSMAENHPLLYGKFVKMLCVEAISTFARQILDRQASKTQLLDDTMMKNEAIRRELAEIVARGTQAATEGNELPEIPTNLKLATPMPEAAPETSQTGEATSKSQSSKPVLNAVEKNKLEIFLKSQMIQSKKRVDRLYEEEKSRALRSEAQLRNAEHKIAVTSSENQRLKEQESKSLAEIARLNKELAQLRQQYEAKTREAKTIQEERDYLQQHLATVHLEFNNLKAAAERLKDENVRLTEELSTAERVAESRLEMEREKSLREKKREITVLLRAIEQSAQKLEQEMKRNEQLTEELDNKNKLLGDKAAEIDRINQKHKEAMTALEDEMQDVTKRANEMHRALVSTVMERDEALARVEKANRSVLATEAALERYKDDIARLRGVAASAKAKLKTVVRVNSQHMLVLFGKLFITKKRLSMVYSMVREVLSQFVALALEEDSARTQLQTDLEQYEALHEYRNTNIMKTTMLQLCEDVVEAIQLSQPFIHFIAAKNKQHKVTSNAFFNRSIELSSAYSTFLKDAEMKNRRKIQYVNQVDELRAENAALQAQNQALRKHISQLLHRQTGHSFIPSASLSLALSSLQGHVEVANWPEKKQPVIPSNGIVDPALMVNKRTSVQAIPARPASAMPQLRGKQQLSFASAARTIAPAPTESELPLPPRLTDQTALPQPPSTTLLPLGPPHRRNGVGRFGSDESGEAEPTSKSTSQSLMITSTPAPSDSATLVRARTQRIHFTPTRF